MLRSAVRTAVMGLLIVATARDCVYAVDPVHNVDWVGSATGEWRDANAWRDAFTDTTGDANAIMGQGNGSDGMNTTDMATTRARNIVIGGGATVNYNGTVNGDFRLRQGTNMTIKDGATWVQATDASYPENIWTRFDPSNFVLDGGAYRRTGQSAGGDGGGILMIASFNDDNNFSRLGAPAKINIEIKNGGELENNGQLWFGADDEHSPDARASITINDGSIDLTGGTIPLTNSTLSVAADLAFFYDYSESLMRPKNEEWEINFTGPGSITVDQAGIWVYRQDEFGIWNIGTAGPLSYEELWNQGILKANGLSGKTGTVPSGINGTTNLTPANFGDFFTVSGMPGMENYTLTSLITSHPDTGLDGDYNNDGKVDAADYVVWRNDPASFGGDPAGYNTWRANFGAMAANGSALAAGGAVPEPVSAVLLLMGVSAVLMRRPKALQRLRELPPRLPLDRLGS